MRNGNSEKSKMSQFMQTSKKKAKAKVIRKHNIQNEEDGDRRRGIKRGA
jgi:hypothetical protein